MIGDYSVRHDNQPKGENRGGFLYKTLRMAGSGVYQYHRSEAPLFGLDEKNLPGDQAMFGLYRPPEVLKANKDLFARIPIIAGKHQLVTTQNAKDVTVGMVGDHVDVETGADGELYIYATGTIIAGDGVDMYERYGQLSVGYVPEAKWESGKHNGEDYQAVLTGFKDVNHVLLCREARGGPQCMVMDSNDDIGGRTVFDKIFKRSPKKLVGDARVPVLLQSIAAGADPETQVKAIKDIVGDTKNADWNDYLVELAACKDERPEVKVAAVNIMQDLYTQICGDMKTDEKKDPPAGDDEKKDPPAGDDEKKDPPEDEKKDPPEDEKKDPPAGDDVSKLVAGLQASITSLQTELAELKATKKEHAIAKNEDALGRLTMALAGDSTKAITTDDFMKSFIGGK